MLIGALLAWSACGGDGDGAVSDTSISSSSASSTTSTSTSDGSTHSDVDPTMVATEGDPPPTSTSTTGTTGTPAPYCGDGNVDEGEKCDDGNALNDDACLDSCVLAVCGDGFVHKGVETCDDGNDLALDGCEPDCSGTPIMTVALGGQSSCVVFEGGQAARCWGDNAGGRLGLNTFSSLGTQPGDMPPPNILVEGTLVQMALGSAHTCGRFDDEQVLCWGYNKDGQLGRGDTIDLGNKADQLPTAPLMGLGAVAEVKTGVWHTCVRLTDGGVRCWGSNGDNKAGYPTVGLESKSIGDEPGEMPPPLVNIGGSAVALGLGYGHSCALLDTGKVRCWGYNSQGQLGIGSKKSVGFSVEDMPPADIDLGPGVVTQLAVSSSQNCVVMQDGDLRCWGQGALGILGNGSLENIGDEPGEMPPPSVNIGGPVVQVALGDTFACALLEGGTVRCWGWGSNGSLGSGATETLGDEPGEMPPPVVDVGGIASQIFAGFQHACALLQDGTLRCWGKNDQGNLGYGHKDTIGDEPGEMPPPPVSVW